jgi:hypothetical protein
MDSTLEMMSRLSVRQKAHVDKLVTDIVRRSDRPITLERGQDSFEAREPCYLPVEPDMEQGVFGSELADMHMKFLSLPGPRTDLALFADILNLAYTRKMT